MKKLRVQRDNTNPRQFFVVDERDTPVAYCGTRRSAERVKRMKELGLQALPGWKRRLLQKMGGST